METERRVNTRATSHILTIQVQLVTKLVAQSQEWQDSSSGYVSPRPDDRVKVCLAPHTPRLPFNPPAAALQARASEGRVPAHRHCTYTGRARPRLPGGPRRRSGTCRSCERRSG